MAKSYVFSEGVFAALKPIEEISLTCDESFNMVAVQKRLTRFEEIEHQIDSMAEYLLDCLRLSEKQTIVTPQLLRDVQRINSRCFHYLHKEGSAVDLAEQQILASKMQNLFGYLAR